MNTADRLIEELRGRRGFRAVLESMLPEDRAELAQSFGDIVAADIARARERASKWKRLALALRQRADACKR